MYKKSESQQTKKDKVEVIRSLGMAKSENAEKKSC